MTSNAIFSLTLATSVCVAVACVSGDLATTAQDPSNPRSAGPPPAPPSSALRPGFEPFEAYGITGPAEGTEHDHGGHHGHAAPATTQDAASVAEPTHASHQHGEGVDGGAKPQPKPGVIYVCPMHPEVRRTEPGRCPKCGMKLEPRKAGSK